MDVVTLGAAKAGVARDLADPTSPIGQAARSQFAQRSFVIYTDLPTSGLWSAHRGSSRSLRPIAPESSMSAYRIALAQGANILDVDYRVTADGVLVAMHDVDVLATTGVAGNVSDYPFHQLPNINMQGYLGGGWADEQIPLIDDILNEFGGRAMLTLEAKDGLASVAPLAAIIHRAGLPLSVYINTNSYSVAQAITDAGCLPHIYGVDSTAKIDAAAAAGAKLIELPYNASTALVDRALASGIHRVITEPISLFSQKSVVDPRLHGYVNDTVGYLNRPGGLATPTDLNLSKSLSSRRRPAGLRLNVIPANGNWIGTDGFKMKSGAEVELIASFGSIARTPAASGSITMSFKMPTLPTDTNQRVGMRVLCPEENSNGLDTDTKGYVVSVRANGQLNCWSSPVGAYGAGVAMGVAPTGAALVAGTVYQIKFEWTATQIRATRVDTGGTTGWVNNTDWRSPFVYTVETMTTGEWTAVDIAWPL